MKTITKKQLKALLRKHGKLKLEVTGSTDTNRNRRISMKGHCVWKAKPYMSHYKYSCFEYKKGMFYTTDSNKEARYKLNPMKTIDRMFVYDEVFLLKIKTVLVNETEVVWSAK